MHDSALIGAHSTQKYVKMKIQREKKSGIVKPKGQIMAWNELKVSHSGTAAGVREVRGAVNL